MLVGESAQDLGALGNVVMPTEVCTSLVGRFLLLERTGHGSQRRVAVRSTQACRSAKNLSKDKELPLFLEGIPTHRLDTLGGYGCPKGLLPTAADFHIFPHWVTLMKGSR